MDKPGCRNLWFYGYIPYKMAAGLLSVLVPLFIVENLKCTLLDVGIVTACFNLAVIPSVIIWGVISDTLGRRKIFVVASFLLTGATLVPLAFAKGVWDFLIWSVLQAFFFTMHEPATNMLIVELNARGKWNEKIGIYQMVSGLGWSAGLIIGAIGVAVYSFPDLMCISAGMYVVASIASLVLIRDPDVPLNREEIAAERAGLSVTERARFHYRWIHRPPNLIGFFKKMVSEVGSDLGLFNLGVFIFSASATIVFTAFPIFFLNEVGLEPFVIFSIFFVNSLASAVGYQWSGVMADKYGDKRLIMVASASRVVLFPLFILCTISPLNSAVVIAIVLLGVIGISWALFSVSSTALSMQLVPRTKFGESSGLYYASTGLGSVIGGFFGGVLPFVFWQSQEGIGIFFFLSGTLFLFPLYVFGRLKVPIA
ncbi:MAG: MFS transporter [Candidatus Bathyarchaeia archaeon]